MLIFFRLRYLGIIVPLALILLCVVVAVFSSEVLTFACFSCTLIIYVLLRYDSRFFVYAAIIMIVLSVMLLSTVNLTLANETAIIGYYLLVIGVFSLLAEYIREQTRLVTRLRKRWKRL